MYGGVATPLALLHGGRPPPRPAPSEAPRPTTRVVPHPRDPVHPRRGGECEPLLPLSSSVAKILPTSYNFNNGGANKTHDRGGKLEHFNGYGGELPKNGNVGNFSNGASHYTSSGVNSSSHFSSNNGSGGHFSSNGANYSSNGGNSGGVYSSNGGVSGGAHYSSSPVNGSGKSSQLLDIDLPPPPLPPHKAQRIPPPVNR